MQCIEIKDTLKEINKYVDVLDICNVGKVILNFNFINFPFLVLTSKLRVERKRIFSALFFIMQIIIKKLFLIMNKLK